MRRRAFIVALAVTTALPRKPAPAQQKPPPVIGYMSGGSASFYAAILPAFRDGLRESGFVEGQNVAIEYRWAEGDYDRLTGFAAEFVRRRVDLIAATGGDRSSIEAKKATSTIPIVFTAGGDPVADGRVASLGRPGGNLTGVSFLTSELYPKRLELLSELVPQARTIAFLINPNQPTTERQLAEIIPLATARGLGLELLRVSSEGDFETAFASVGNHGAGALMVQTDPLIDPRTEQLTSLAARYSIPTVYGFRQFAIAGGLISYGISIADVYRQAGSYAGKILAGAKTADLPVVQPTKFELVINLKTAKTLGLTVPQSLLARADEVIE
jgi:putative tryptophan/tyrosine transport system substrate-binding protein